ncbi:MAG: exodeoxyribonuclease V subunit beta [Gemmatimonas sp.]|nr:exodeoxyribonuclease V subunit beta [Gemmatimonas sp.]
MTAKPSTAPAAREAFRADRSPFLPGISLIEASAGTGKTFNIAKSMVRLLLERRSDGAWMVEGLANILVVTFTKAATNELVTRIREELRLAARAFAAPDMVNTANASVQILRAMAAGREEDAAMRLREAVATLDTLAVFTIHGFCKRVLDEYALESGTPFEAELLEDEQDLERLALQDWWRRSVYSDRLLAALVVSEGWTPNQFHADYRMARRAADVRLDPDESAEIVRAELLEQAMAFMRAWQHLGASGAEQWLGNKPFKASSAMSMADARRALFAQVDGAVRESEVIQQPTVGLLTLVRQFSTKALSRDFDRRSKAGKAAVTDLALQPLVEAADSVLASIARMEQALRADCVHFVERWIDTEKTRRASLGFDDLLQRLADALQRQGPEGLLARAVRSQFQAALIDEFQDTDTHQFAIFRTALHGCPLFLIGDPKQAIYGFRGADVQAYLTAADTAERQFTLERNFRSTPRMVDAVNALFARRLEPFVDDGIVYHAAQAATHAAEPASLPGGPHALHWLFVPPTTGRSGQPAFTGATEARRLLFAACARHIVRNIEDGWTPGKLAVLVRSASEGIEMAAVLRQARVPAVVSGLGDVMQSEEAAELLLVLEGIAAPRQVARLRAALGTTLWGLSHADLLRLATPDAESAWTAITDSVHGLRERWTTRGLLPMLQQWYAERSVAERLLGEPAGERRLTNLRHLEELLHAAVVSEHLNVEGTLRWLRTQMAEAEEQGDRPGNRPVTELRLESDADAVQIVTVHKSKGLEYDVVYCPTLWSAYPVQPDAPVLVHEQDGVVLDHGSPQRPARQAPADRERLAEESRLLYVALTRARFRTVVGWGPITHRKRGDVAAQSALSWLLFDAAVGGVPDSGAVSALPMAAALAASPQVWQAHLEAVIAAHRDLMAMETADSTLVSPLSLARAIVQPAPVVRTLPDEPTPDRRFDTYRIASFTSLSRPLAGAAAVRDVDDPNEGTGTAPSEDGPVLSPRDLPREDFRAFPAGREAGIALHALFEHSAFDETPAMLRPMVVQHLHDAGLLQAPPEIDLRVNAVVDMMQRTLGTPIPLDASGLPSFALREVRGDRARHEWQFLLPMGAQDAAVTRDRLALAFAQHGVGPVSEYAEALRALGPTQLHGYLTGFVDLLFEHDGRWWVVDWKSNQLGTSPAAYTADALTAVMVDHHYILQYHLYLTAAYRFLRHRMPDFEYDRHMGGAAYAFLRGFGSFNPAPGQGWFVDRPPRELIEALSAAFGEQALA